MANWYDDFDNFDMTEVTAKSTGMDYFLDDEDFAADVDVINLQEVHGEMTGAIRVRIASANQLKGFRRVANTNTLIRMSEHDLWSLNKEGDEYVIERLVDDEGNPIKA